MKTVLDNTTVLKVTDELKEIVHMISGMEKEEMDENKKLISYGLDSILLLTLAKQLFSKYRVEIPLDVFFTTLNTLHVIAEYIAEHGVVEDVQEEEIREEETQEEANMETFEVDSLPEEINSTEDMTLNSDGKMDMGMLVKVFNSQYEIMTKQNEILKVMAGATAGKKAQ